MLSTSGEHVPGAGGPVRVAVLGTGVIGQDLVSRIGRSPWLRCGLVAGRDPDSPGLRRAAERGCPTSADGIRAVLASEEPFAVVFDATSALSHAEHARLLAPLGTLLVDLTPSRLGRTVVPAVTGVTPPDSGSVSLISCGGQAAIPVVHALARRFDVRYVEVVSTVASVVAGRATRLNLDEYVATTAEAVTAFSGVSDAKAILNISPAVPPAVFRTAVHAVAPGADPDEVRAVAGETAERVRVFAPGYRVVACTASDGRVVVCVEVTAAGDVLPAYAGNLDIIDAAAVLVAERHAARAAAGAEVVSA
ncbi:acetaldehyde dehydrogenase (acetylating) [Streptomyces omiyaensis]|uniref:Acetaldehyde dehydrogenase n=1 Tax=Streptomyces omiyaensis TaxID=68247 RepID=A0ABW7BUL7_9ACTN